MRDSTLYINRFIEEANSKDGNINIHYISVYGLEKKEDIDDRIFEAMHPILGSKPVKIISNLLRTAVKMGIGIKINNADLSLSPELGEINIDKSKIDKVVLVIDDVERSAVPIETLLGYIGNMIEGTSNKVILLGDEEKLVQKYPIIYSAIKEKVIGQTFELKDDPEEAIGSFISRYESISKNNNVYKVILDVYYRLKYRNLRSVKQAIDMFSYLYTVIDNKYKENQSLIEDIVRVFFTLSLESKAGNLEKIPIEDAINIEFARNMTISEFEKLPEAEKKKINESFIYSYMMNKRKIPLNSLWQDIIHDGKISQVDINNNLHQSYYSVDETKIPVLYQLMNIWRDLSAAEFKKYYKLLQDEAKVIGLYTQGDILHFASMCVFFSKNGLIRKDPQNIVKEAKASLKKLYMQSTAEILDDIHFLLHGYRGFAYSTEPEMKEIWEYLAAENEACKTRRIEGLLFASLNTLPVNIEELFENFSTYNASAKFANIPVLKIVDVKKFCKLLVGLNSKDKWRFIDLLKHRYGSAFSNGVFERKYETEKTFLQGLIREVGLFLKGKSSISSPNIVEMRNINKELDDILAYANK